MPRRPARPRRTPRARRLTVAGALALVMACGACAQVRDQMTGAETDPVEDVAATPVLETVDWGVLDGIVSVLVQNTTDRTLERAEAVVTLRDDAGEPLDPGDGQAAVEGPCCTALDVPPGGRFGFYFVVGDLAGRVGAVDVAYKDVSWAPTGSDGGPTATAQPGQLVQNPSGTLATATVQVSGGPVDDAIVQAVVEDAAGGLVAVISGEWYCLRPGETRLLRMQLFARVPPGSRIDEVNVFPLSEPATGGDANLESTCDEQASADQGGADGGSTQQPRRPSGADGSGAGQAPRGPVERPGPREQGPAGRDDGAGGGAGPDTGGARAPRG